VEGPVAVPTFEGRQTAAGCRFAIVVARFNDFVTSRLLSGAREALAAADVAADAIDVVWVPGAFEVAAAAQHVATARRPSAVICLGCVIRGGTPHFEYICAAAAHGVTSAALTSGVPMAFGILTVDSVEQAVERAGPGPTNKGYEAAMAAVEMATLRTALEARS
jgi:6,7-dimethyl-8-ribityllumazine synthase